MALSTEQSSHYEPFLAHIIITSNQPIASADLPAISDASDDGYEASLEPLLAKISSYTQHTSHASYLYKQCFPLLLQYHGTRSNT